MNNKNNKNMKTMNEENQIIFVIENVAKQSTYPHSAKAINAQKGIKKKFKATV